MSVMLQIRKKWTQGLKIDPCVHFFNIDILSPELIKNPVNHRDA